MSANTYQQLLDFNGNLASAWGSILSADLTALIGTDTHATNTAFLFGPRDNTGSMPVDRIEYTATNFRQASNQQVKAASNGSWFFAHYAGQLMTSVCTPRSVNVAAAMHGARVGRLVSLAQPAFQRFTSNNLPFYEIAYLGLAAAPHSVPQDDEDIDRTDLVFDVELWIKADAFPTTIA